jgi:hypothetical protein
MPRSRSLRDQRLELGPAGIEGGEFGPCLVERGVGPGLVCGWSAVGRRAVAGGVSRLAALGANLLFAYARRWLGGRRLDYGCRCPCSVGDLRGCWVPDARAAAGRFLCRGGGWGVPGGGRRWVLGLSAGADNWLWSRRMSGLPAGAVTFLFTDIEGSTRLVKALRDRYPQVLAEHRRLVRVAVAGQAGA